MLDREGVSGPAELSIVGNETTLRAEIARLRDVGVTDFNAAVITAGDSKMATTLDFLQSELA